MGADISLVPFHNKSKGLLPVAATNTRSLIFAFTAQQQQQWDQNTAAGGEEVPPATKHRLQFKHGHVLSDGCFCE